MCWGRREDFTIVRGIVEKLGSSSLTSNIKDFDRFIRESELIDPPLRTGPFTGSNMQEFQFGRGWIDFCIQTSGIPSKKCFPDWLLIVV